MVEYMDALVETCVPVFRVYQWSGCI